MQMTNMTFGPNGPNPLVQPKADETAEALDIITKRLLPVVVRKIAGIEATQTTLMKMVQDAPAAPAMPDLSGLEDRLVSLVKAYDERLDAMAHSMADMTARIAELETAAPKARAKRTSANVVSKFNRLTASEVAAVNHVLRQTSSPDAASRFTGVPLPVVRYIAAMAAEDYAQHVLHKRTPSESRPPEGLDESDFQYHWTVPIGSDPDTGTDDILPASAVGEEDAE